MLATALLLQVAAVAPGVDFDLRAVPPRDDCTPGRSDEIVVCGRPDPDRHRLPPLPDARYAQAPARAETRLFGDAVGSAAVESEEIANGIVSNRVMLRMKVPF